MGRGMPFSFLDRMDVSGGRLRWGVGVKSWRKKIDGWIDTL